MKKYPKYNTGEQRVGGWVQNTRQLVYENPWIAVSHEEVTRPNGSHGVYGVVHFKGRAVGVVPVDASGNTWLVRQSRYSCNEMSLEIPEGGGLFSETPLQTAERELEEETGLKAHCWSEIMVLRTSNSVTDEIAHIFLATDVFEGKQKLDDSEDIEIVKMPLCEAVDRALSGDITDAMSVSALLKIALLRSDLI